MLYAGIFLTALLGFVCVNCLSVKFTLIEKIGLSFPLGMALQIFLMLFIDQAGIPLKPAVLLGGEALLLAGLCLFVYLYRKDAVETIRTSVSLQSFKNINLVWLFFILAIAYLEYMNFSKCLYFPPSDRDSLAGFETIGYIIAQEHTLKGLSIFDNAYMPGIHGGASYITYAPLVQLSYAYVYALGAETSKIIPGLMYLFFLLAFYGATSRAAGKTGAAVATFFMLLTPEMLAFSSLSMTNVIHAVFASLSVIYMALWFRGREKKDLLLCGMLLGGNILSRTEGIVFTGAVLFLLFIDAFRTKQYKGFLQHALLALVPLVCWTLYTKINGLYAASIAITHPFWDPEKASTILTYMWQLYKNTMYYGWTFGAFLSAFLANLWFLIKKRDSLYLLLAIGLSSAAYVLVLYQIDYMWDTIDNVLSYSAKRFMFCFVPVLWYFSVSNQAVRTNFEKLERFLSFGVNQAR
ncbi:MAG: glycosyltransferase family 39 protein [Tannerellaceae bacterium]|nr:glycosyltransferase family 39 protein [Tannerellaceae bacterium]